MLVLDDEGGRAAALAEDLQGRLEALGVYRRERRTWLPHLTVARFREPTGLRAAPAEQGNICSHSVRRLCLPVTTAAGRRAVRDSRIVRALSDFMGGQ